MFTVNCKRNRTPLVWFNGELSLDSAVKEKSLLLCYICQQKAGILFCCRKSHSVSTSHDLIQTFQQHNASEWNTSAHFVFNSS